MRNSVYYTCYRILAKGCDEVELYTGCYNVSAFMLDDDIDAEVLGFEFDVALLNCCVYLLYILILNVNRLTTLCDLVRYIDYLGILFGYFSLNRDLERLNRLPLVAVLIEDLDVISSNDLGIVDFDLNALSCYPGICRKQTLHVDICTLCLDLLLCELDVSLGGFCFFCSCF